MEYLHKYVAKCVNASMGRWENLWSSEQPSLVALHGDEAVLKRMVYTATNPVESYLVESSEQWPGLRTSPKDLLGGAIKASRPSVFFRPTGPTPEIATLKLTRPPIFKDLDDQEFVEKFQQAIWEREQELRQEAKENKIRFVGLRKLRAQKPTDTPQSIEPRRNLKPRVASHNKWSRIEALLRVKSFVEEYREAWQKWKAGMRNVVFPHGTYALARHAGVAIAPG
jgi:hypothetical protein